MAKCERSCSYKQTHPSLLSFFSFFQFAVCTKPSWFCSWGFFREWPLNVLLVCYLIYETMIPALMNYILYVLEFDPLQPQEATCEPDKQAFLLMES